MATDGLKSLSCKYGAIQIEVGNAQMARFIAITIDSINWQGEGLPAVACRRQQEVEYASVLELWVPASNESWETAKAASGKADALNVKTDSWRWIRTNRNASRTGTSFFFVENGGLSQEISRDGRDRRFKYAPFTTQGHLRIPPSYNPNAKRPRSDLTEDDADLINRIMQEMGRSA